MLKFAAAGVGVAAAAAAAFALIVRWKKSRTWLDLSRDARLKGASLSGQIIVITGANTGLGFEAALDFARRGAEAVVLACRNVLAGNEAARKIRKATGNDNVRCLLLDLASLDSVRSFADQFKVEYGDRLDCLVCNAGVFMPMEDDCKTADGFEVHFGVNHLGHFLLTNLLRGALENRSGRVVVVSSSLMMCGDVGDVDSYDFNRGRRVSKPTRIPTGYSDSKLMNGLFVRECAIRFPELGGVYATCPGWCKTELGRYSARNASLVKKLLMAFVALMFMRSSAQGAQNIIYLVVEDREKLKSGTMYRDGRVAEDAMEKLQKFESQAPKLWQISERFVKG